MKKKKPKNKKAKKIKKFLEVYNLEEELIRLIAPHMGEHYDREDIVETLERIIRERDILLKRVILRLMKPARMFEN